MVDVNEVLKQYDRLRREVLDKADGNAERADGQSAAPWDHAWKVLKDSVTRTKTS